MVSTPVQGTCIQTNVLEQHRDSSVVLYQYTLMSIYEHFVNIQCASIHVQSYCFIPVSGTSGAKHHSITPVAYTVPVVLVLIIALLVLVLTLVVVIRTRKRKRARGRGLAQIQSPDPTATFRKMMTENGQFTPVSLLSPMGASNVYRDPLEFPRNRLYIYTGIVLGMLVFVHMYTYSAC